MPSSITTMSVCENASILWRKSAFDADYFPGPSSEVNSYASTSTHWPWNSICRSTIGFSLWRRARFEMHFPCSTTIVASSVSIHLRLITEWPPAEWHRVVFVIQKQRSWLAHDRNNPRCNSLLVRPIDLSTVTKRFSMLQRFVSIQRRAKWAFVFLVVHNRQHSLCLDMSMRPIRLRSLHIDAIRRSIDRWAFFLLVRMRILLVDHRVHGNHVMHESVVSIELMIGESRFLLYEHSARCPTAMEIFLRCDPQDRSLSGSETCYGSSCSLFNLYRLLDILVERQGMQQYRVFH